MQPVDRSDAAALPARADRRLVVLRDAHDLATAKDRDLQFVDPSHGRSDDLTGERSQGRVRSLLGHVDRAANRSAQWSEQNQ